MSNVYIYKYSFFANPYFMVALYMREYDIFLDLIIKYVHLFQNPCISIEDINAQHASTKHLLFNVIFRFHSKLY